MPQATTQPVVVFQTILHLPVIITKLVNSLLEHLSFTPLVVRCGLEHFHPNSLLSVCPHSFSVPQHYILTKALLKFSPQDATPVRGALYTEAKRTLAFYSDRIFRWPLVEHIAYSISYNETMSLFPLEELPRRGLMRIEKNTGLYQVLSSFQTGKSENEKRRKKIGWLRH